MPCCAMSKPHRGFWHLAAFTAMPYEKAEERYKLSEVDETPPDGFDIGIEDIFGEEPETVFVHKGPVHHDGDVTIGAVGEYAGIYIIDGDLEVGGLLSFTQVDGGSVLYVKGDLRARDLAMAQEAQLWVSGNLKITGHVLTALSQAGGLAVKKRATAKAFVVTDAAPLSFGKQAKGSFIERSAGLCDEEAAAELAQDALVAPFDREDLDYDALVEAARKGQPILR
jgi:hypothetical protein